MRVVWAWCLTLFAAAATVCAAPVNPQRAATSPDHALQSEALSYASAIVELVNRIQQEYVKPVSRLDLYEAALVGLYEAAREPVPAGLRADIRQAVEGDITGLLIRVREGLGHSDALRQEKALLASLQALPRVLDPYCGLTSRREFQRLDVADNTPNTGLEFVGVPLVTIGVALFPGGVRPSDAAAMTAQQPAPAGPLRVQNVQPGSPAHRAGVRPGDMITRLNGHPPEAPEFVALFQRLRPVQAGVPIRATEMQVRLTVVRAGRPNPFELTVGVDRYRPESVFGARRRPDGSWNFMLDPAQRIGYVRVGGIREMDTDDDPEGKYGTPREFRDALRSLRTDGVRGLVLDLRWCPGGYLREAATVARLLLPREMPKGKGVAFQQEPRRDQPDQPAALTPVEFYQIDEPYTDFPVVALINGETSGGGELIAAALQDHRRAAIAGQRTVGKGSIQTQPNRRVVNGIPFKLTTSTFLRPSGKNLQRFPDSKPTDDWGVRPDEGRDLPLTPDASRRLKDWWTLQTLRAPDDFAALPLDDPENDPQRSAAVEMLRAMIQK
jgi:C-terminal peptidase prc